MGHAVCGSNLSALLYGENMLTKDETEAFQGLDESYEKAEQKINVPKCHFAPMSYEASDHEEWWICHHCGHTKSIGFMDFPH